MHLNPSPKMALIGKTKRKAFREHDRKYPADKSLEDHRNRRPEKDQLTDVFERSISSVCHTQQITWHQLHEDLFANYRLHVHAVLASENS